MRLPRRMSASRDVRTRPVTSASGGASSGVSAGVARLEEFSRRPGRKAVFQAAQSGVITVVRHLLRLPSNGWRCAPSSVG